MDPKTTGELLSILNSADDSSDLEKYLSNHTSDSKALSFAEYFCSILDAKHLSRAQVIRESGIERTYGYQLLNGLRQPGRDKILCLCIAAGLSLKETQRALEISQAGILYSRCRRDAVIIFALNKQLSCKETSELLIEMGEDDICPVD